MWRTCIHGCVCCGGGYHVAVKHGRRKLSDGVVGEWGSSERARACMHASAERVCWQEVLWDGLEWHQAVSIVS